MFTDIVGSTERAWEVGDTAWAEILARHESAPAPIVPENGGRLVKTTGDGLPATFFGLSGAVGAVRVLQDAAVGSRYVFEHGSHALQGIPDTW